MSIEQMGWIWYEEVADKLEPC